MGKGGSPAEVWLGLGEGLGEHMKHVLGQAARGRTRQRGARTRTLRTREREAANRSGEKKSARKRRGDEGKQKQKEKPSTQVFFLRWHRFSIGYLTPRPQV